MCRGNGKRDVTTMVTYSHASTPLGQSERAYYLGYFIKKIQTQKKNLKGRIRHDILTKVYCVKPRIFITSLC